MNLFLLFGASVLACSVSIVLRQYKPEYSMFVSLSAGILIFLFVLSQSAPIIETAGNLIEKTGMPVEYGKVLVKSLGICFFTQLASDCCKDCGESAIGTKVELAGKTAILLAALPLFEKLLETATALITG